LQPDDTGATPHIVCPEGVTRFGGAEFKQCEGWHLSRRSGRREEEWVAPASTAATHRLGRLALDVERSSGYSSLSNDPKVIMPPSPNPTAAPDAGRCRC